MAGLLTTQNMSATASTSPIPDSTGRFFCTKRLMSIKLITPFGTSYDKPVEIRRGHIYNKQSRHAVCSVC